MRDSLYVLSSEDFSGNRWRRECIADEKTCLEIANQIDGTPLEFQESSHSQIRKAIGKCFVFFLNPTYQNTPDLIPGVYRHTYCG